MCKFKEQLGMSGGSARHQLVQSLLYDMADKLGLLNCYQCGCEIETLEELSIEHKTPWRDSDSPLELYFDLDNIAFSHRVCNTQARRYKRGEIVENNRGGKYRARVQVNKVRHHLGSYDTEQLAQQAIDEFLQHGEIA